MQEEEVIAELVALVEGKIAPAAWVSWWTKNSTQLQGLLPRTAFLKLKPNVAFGETRAAFVAQTGALEYLSKKGISVVRADKYATAWQSEEAKRESQNATADKTAKERFSTNFQELKQNFPGLYKCLKKYSSSVDVLTPGKSANDISAKEQLLQCSFSDNQRLFMQSISVLQTDGVKYSFNDIRWLELASVMYLVWGEYWLEGDGDLVLFAPNSDRMYYLGHAGKVPQPKLLSANFNEFIERNLVQFITENEE